jgi:hypothetical protein
VRRLALVALFAAACGPTPAPVPGQSLALAYHKGDVYNYSFELTAHETIDTVQETLHETAHLTYTVRSVDAGENAELSLDLSNVVITATVDQITVPMSSSPNPTIDLKVAADGRILSQNVNGSGFGGVTIWAVLPGRAVKPGDRWSKDYDTNAAGYSGNSHLTTTSKYLRDESFQGANAAVVESTIGMTSHYSSGPSAAGGSQATVKVTSMSIVTTWIDRDAHRILKSHVTATFDQKATFDAASAPPPTATSIMGDETADMLPG